MTSYVGYRSIPSHGYLLINHKTRPYNWVSGNLLTGKSKMAAGDYIREIASQIFVRFNGSDLLDFHNESQTN